MYIKKEFKHGTFVFCNSGHYYLKNIQIPLGKTECVTSPCRFVLPRKAKNT